MSKAAPLPNAPPSVGAARGYAIALFGGPVAEIFTRVQVTTSSTPIVLGNGDRVGLVLSNTSSFDMNVEVQGIAVGQFSGIKLGALGGVVTMNVHDDFTLQTNAFNAVAIGGTGFLDVWEIVRVSY